MNDRRTDRFALGVLALLVLASGPAPAKAAPSVSRLTPPSVPLAAGNPHPTFTARFLPGQRFDLQATVLLDPGTTLRDFVFLVDGHPVPGSVQARSIVTTGLTLPADTNAAVVSQRAVSLRRPGLHTLIVRATQSDGQIAEAAGHFEIVATGREGRPARNVIILLGDGMGAAHRTAARIVGRGYAQGKAQGRLAMDAFPVTGMVMTSSLDSIVTDSSPGMSSYVTGNKAANNQQGVWPDDTADAFDNPRVEYLSEYLHRTQGKALGIVTTADVFDATPAAMAVHTSNRGHGTGIVDQFLDDRHLSGLAVLLGGGRRWFLPGGDGSQRDERSDYELPGDIVAGWGASRGRRDPQRDLIADFGHAGYAYASDKASLLAEAPGAGKLLGLFAPSNMSPAFDRIGGRRGSSTVVQEDGLPDQPMLDEMTRVALDTLSRHKKGFVALIEGASIDKQSHRMDTGRWLLEMIEFDRAVQVARDFADKHPDTIVIVTADHECGGVALLGTHPAAKFPHDPVLPDGYPAATDVAPGLRVAYGGQVPGKQSSVHTATDVPLSAHGRGAAAFTGVMDNTDVFFKLARIVGAR